MTRLVLCIVIGAIIPLANLSAYPLTHLSEAEMKECIGQAGVNVWIMDVKVWQHVGEAIYTDGDGVTGKKEDAASVILSDQEYELTFKAITAITDEEGSLEHNYSKLNPDLKYSPLVIETTNRASILTELMIYNKTTFELPISQRNYVTEYVDNNFSTASDSRFDSHIGVLSKESLSDYNNLSQSGKDQYRTEWIRDNRTTIRSTLTASARNSASYAALENEINNLAVSAVVATLPTLEITKTESTQTFRIWAANAINNNKAFVTITNGPSVMAILSGTVEISAH